MQYWCEKPNYGYTYSYSRKHGYGYSEGYLSSFSPSMLVTGVKLEEVVLNAILLQT